MAELYTVAQLTELLGVSDVTIYSKLKIQELKPHIIVKDRKKHLTEDGLVLLRSLLSLNSDLKSPENSKSENLDHSKEIEVFKDLVKTLKDQNAFLQAQLEAKDRQLESGQQSVLNMQYLIKNTQEILPTPIPWYKRLLKKGKG